MLALARRCRIERAADGSFDLHTFSCAGQAGGSGSVINCSSVMFATGRMPNTRGIGLEVGAGQAGGRVACMAGWLAEVFFAAATATLVVLHHPCSPSRPLLPPLLPACPPSLPFCLAGRGGAAAREEPGGQGGPVLTHQRELLPRQAAVSIWTSLSCCLSCPPRLTVPTSQHHHAPSPLLACCASAQHLGHPCACTDRMNLPTFPLTAHCPSPPSLPPQPTHTHAAPQVPSIWAIGDCTDRMNLTPVALMEGKALVATLFGGQPTVPDYDNVSARVGVGVCAWGGAWGCLGRVWDGNVRACACVCAWGGAWGCLGCVWGVFASWAGMENDDNVSVSERRGAW